METNSNVIKVVEDSGYDWSFWFVDAKFFKGMVQIKASSRNRK